MNIYLCQFTNLFDNNVYLPYSIGIITAYLQKFHPSYGYNLLFIKEDFDKLLLKIKKPDYLLFSTYVWNFNFSIKFAKRVKELYPNCKIVLGGHHVPDYKIDFFRTYPFLDIVVYGEGEIACKEIIDGKSLYTINNISFNKDGYNIGTKQLFNNLDLNEFPSPYLTGIFDEILKTKLDYTGILETNRGCPFGCAYCDWGNCKTSPKKLRFFNKERIFKEIEWFGKNKIQYLFGADSNFGIVKSDMAYVDKLIETKKQYGYPEKFRVCFTKNSDDFVFDINNKLNKKDLAKGATLSFQSLNADSLKAVKRKNISISTFSNLIKKYEDNNISTYTEMILGLPCETFDTFVNGLCQLLKKGQHSSIIVYNCQVYPNSEINSRQFRTEYDLKTESIPVYSEHSIIDFNDILEYSEVIVSTNIMDKSDFIKSCLFSWAIQTFHCLGLTQIIARYLNHKYDISYKKFYFNLLEGIVKSDSLLNKEYIKILDKYKDISEGITYFHPSMPNFNWTLEEGSFLSFIEQKELFYTDLYNILIRYYSPTMVRELVDVNSALIRNYNSDSKNLVLNIFKLDILKFLKIKHEFRAILIIKPKLQFSKFSEYAKEIVWYGRKGSKFFYSGTEIK